MGWGENTLSRLVLGPLSKNQGGWNKVGAGAGMEEGAPPFSILSLNSPGQCQGDIHNPQKKAIARWAASRRTNVY